MAGSITALHHLLAAPFALGRYRHEIRFAIEEATLVVQRVDFLSGFDKDGIMWENNNIRNVRTFYGRDAGHAYPSFCE